MAIAAPDVELVAPGLVTVTPLVMVQTKLVEPEKLLWSVAVTVTGNEPVVAGVPVTAPVVLSMETPLGRPVADHVSVEPDCESVADGVSDTAVPVNPVRLVMGETVTELVIVQVKEVDPAWPVSSWATTTTGKLPEAVGVPLIVPVVAEMARPVGRPVADQVMVEPDT